MTCSKAAEGSRDPCDEQQSSLGLIPLLPSPRAGSVLSVSSQPGDVPGLMSIFFATTRMALPGRRTVLLAWFERRFSYAFLKVPLTDNLLLLSHYFGMCKLLRWYPPFLWGPFN